MLAALLIALIVMLFVDVGLSEHNVAASTPLAVIGRVIAHHLPVVGAYVPQTVMPDYVESIVWQIRVPRAVAGIFVGMLLALAGVAFQSLLMNPLADPYTTGVASGSAMGTILLGIFGGGAWAAWLNGFALVGAAFASGLLAVSIVYMMARINGRVSPQSFLLSGTIVGSFFFALVPLLLSTTANSGPQQQAAILSTLFGSLNNIGWDKCALLVPFAALGLGLLWTGASELDIMALGEESAAHLGVDTEAFKRRIIVIGALMTAAAVSVAGIIAFVGFLVPHLARRLVGSNHRDLVPASALLGGFVVLLAECLSRVAFNNLGIGVITSLLGVPFFCALMRRRMVGKS